MTVATRFRIVFAFVCVGIALLTSVVVTRANEARTKRAAIATAAIATAHVSPEHFARAAEHYWR